MALLLVPLHLDALVLANEQHVLHGTADWSLLPFSTGSRDVNASVANISEDVVEKPLQTPNLTLKSGIHLHWSLPDALTKGTATSAGTSFPAVPNRWLVTRSRLDDETTVIEQQWVVESDYLYADGAGEQSGSVTIPVTPNPASGERYPFRFLGRKLPFAAWRDADQAATYLDSLTTLGYGDPNFAALYANCHSVFGLYDDAYTAPEAGLCYDVIGWYANGQHDALADFVASFLETYQQAYGAVPDAATLKAGLEDAFQWTFADEAAAFPQQMVCFARLSFATDKIVDNPALQSAVTLAVGNTGTEALSAYLASVVAPEQKSQVEDQLEAVQLMERLSHRQLDIGPAFYESRHEKGFTGLVGGTLWTIRSQSVEDAAADATTGQEQVTLPDALAHQLNSLNTIQQAYDCALATIESHRKQLFADWYKYMLSAYPPEESRDDYPDVDEVRYFLSAKDMQPLERWIKAAGTCVWQTDSDQNVTVASAGDSASTALATALATAINGILETLKPLNAELAPQNIRYGLKPTPAPRYWQPNDPVVLMIGAAVEPSNRHGQDGRLDDDGLLVCSLADGDLDSALNGDFEAIRRHIDSLVTDAIGFQTWTTQPWNPFLLEWEVELFPLAGENNLDPSNRAYSATFIATNYQLTENSVDFSIQPNQGVLDKTAAIYSGSSLLTAHAKSQLQMALEAFLAQPPDGIDLAVYQDALTVLDDPGFYSLSQTLGGFHEALLMQRQTLQFDIADPLGFDYQQSWTAKVAALVQQSNRSAPQPLFDFHPIRSGAIKVSRLRLVDTFGQTKELDTGTMIATEPMITPGSQGLVWMNPRLAQPCRLNVRWLSAQNGEQEMTDHPASSPICGWIVPNHLDQSLQVFDSTGQALGMVAVVGGRTAWEPAPGSQEPIAAAMIENRYLRQMIAGLTDQPASFFDDFFLVLDSALDAIDPENATQHQDLAVLTGRPIALVRIAISMEVLGAPAVNQSWNAFRQDLQRNTRATDGFTQVRFPVRLGEYQQLNDGTVGYWCETKDGGLEPVFYAPQSVEVADDAIRTHANHSMTIDQWIDAPPQTLSVLMDPRGSIHATAGIVPVKALSLPPDQYLPALQAINVTFMTAPVLTLDSTISLPLPNEAGYEWSWLSQNADGAWSEITTVGLVTRQGFLEAFGEHGQPIWDQLVSKVWISPLEFLPDQARVIPTDQRGEADLGADFAADVVAIEALLRQSAIQRVDVTAQFAGSNVLCEGWLRLRQQS